MMLFYSFGSIILLFQTVFAQQSTGQATYFEVGLGACGWVNVATDFIVALNHEQFDVGTGYPVPQCGRGLTIHHNGKSAHATVADRCPSCAYGDLDMSIGLFSYLEALSVGRFSMTWNWDGDAPSETPSPTSTPFRESTRAPATSHNTTAAIHTSTPRPSTSIPHHSATTTIGSSPSIQQKANNAVLHLAKMINQAAVAADTR